ncbi:interferon gamma receptor 1 [Plectropomus leopardus]|uniref:interferon gamma receptor 1 n=1 Tax=Plectropomus leopardus TaxID=160734 RepID=UPI001C4B680B|nr:interferon gamma receptor 1 [Plectropomus leopardus]
MIAGNKRSPPMTTKTMADRSSRCVFQKPVSELRASASPNTSSSSSDTSTITAAGWETGEEEEDEEEGEKRDYGEFPLISSLFLPAVPPPKNVTLSCSNLKVTASWDPSKQHPQTRFKVHIQGSAGDSENETTDHHYDLSPFVWASEDRYLGFHYVTVTAIVGDNQSEPVKSQTFTFNTLKLAHIMCELDFPPVDLDENDSGATVSFVNPFHFYRELKLADKPDTAAFKFNVSSDGVSLSRPAETCTLEQEQCKRDISFPEKVDKCVILKGWLNAGNNVGEVMFRKTHRVCPSVSTELHAIALTVMLFILAIVIALIVIAVCKLKVWTIKMPNLPDILNSDLQNCKEYDPKYAPVPQESFSPLTVSEPCKNPSISSEEENDLPPDLDSSAGSGIQRLYMEAYGRGYDSTDNSEKTEIVSIDLEEEEGEGEEEASAYDRPHTLQVDMGDGEMITCYSKW